jgi:CHAT domain-containing protein
MRNRELTYIIETRTMPTDPYQQLVIDAAGCGDEEQVINILHERRNLVDGRLLSLFMDPQQNQVTKQSVTSIEQFERLTTLVQEQYQRNLIDQYLRTPEQQVPSFVRPMIRVLVLEHSFNYLASLLVHFQDQEEQANYLTVRMHMLVGFAIDYLLYIDDKKVIKEMIYAGPSFFTNPIAKQILSKRANVDGPFKQKSIYLIQFLAEYNARFPEDQIVDQRLHNLLGNYFVSENTEERLAILQEAIAIGQREPPQVVAYVQFLLGSAYLDSLQGSRPDKMRAAKDCFNKSLQFYTKATDLYHWSALQNGLGRASVFSEEGVASENIETAIGYFRNALEGFTKDVAPYSWAISQNNLGAAYLERVAGNKAKNIEDAIECFQLALTIQSPEFTPDDWAMTMMHLGDALNNKYGRERPVSAQKALEYYYKALTVYTKEGYPIIWAKVKTKVADAYHTMAASDRAQNLEQALQHVRDALTVLNRTIAPHEWAISQSTLAKIYVDRIEGERMQNIENAIQLLESVSAVNTREKTPYSWAIDRLNLAHCYRARLRGTAKENQERAILNLHQALDVLVKQHYPIDWASVQHLLGILYYERVAGDKKDDYEKAIECFQSALEVRTRNNVPNSWIESMNSLANTYQKRILGQASDNIEKAIDCFTEVINNIQVADNPMLWAVVHYNAGLAYRDRLTGRGEDNNQNAIKLLKKSLAIHTPTVDPVECFKAAANLGKLYFSMNRYVDAKQTLRLCHESIENMRADSAHESSRSQIAAEAADVYQTLVASCLLAGNVDDAFYYATAAKARLFADKLGGKARNPVMMAEGHPELQQAWTKISRLRREIDQLISQRQYQNSSITVGGKNVSDTIAAKRAALAHSLEEAFFKFPELSLNDDAPIAKPEAIRQLSLTLNAVLIEYFMSATGWGAFVVYDNKILHVPLPEVSQELVKSIAQTMFKYEAGVVSGTAPEYYNKELFAALANLYDHFFEPIESHVPSGGSLVLALSQDLHMLPFAIAYEKIHDRYLIDRYTISYMPSLGTLENLHRRMQLNARGSGNKTILSVAYSARDTSNPLQYALKEAQQIAAHFDKEPESVYLHEDQATPANVLRSCEQNAFDTMHFSCHGIFNANDPMNSGLLLKDGFLTAERTRTELRLSDFPLIILSACQSGITQWQEGDDGVGLVYSFFNAGAGTVISGQWSVADEAAQLIFEQFCENRKTMDAAKALRESMLMIRAMPEWNHPIYWAAFKLTGLV